MRNMALVGPHRFRSFPLLLVAAMTASALAAVPPAGASATGSHKAASTMSAAAPAVRSFSVTPKKLPSQGGRVTVSAKLSRSKTCTLSSVPALKGLPAVLPCASGQLQRSILLPADKSPKAGSYTFRLSAKGSGGVAHSARVTVTVQGLLPSSTTTTTTVPTCPTSTTAPAAGAPAVSGVCPDFGSTAGGDSVTISGSNFAGVAAVNFGTAAAAFKVVSASEITAVSPPGTAGHVNITVVAGAGTSATSPADDFTYFTPGSPAIGSINPASGPTAGGTSVQINGINLAGATSVKFGSIAAAFSVVSGTEITATSPPEAAGGATVWVVTPGGTANSATQFNYVNGPTISAITPTAGAISGGTTVAITGGNLAGATEVEFGSQPAHFTVVSATEITAVSPPGAVGAVTVTVVTPGGSSSAATQFSYQAGPSINTITPTSGPIFGGTTVTITGTDLTAATEVDFGSQKATFSVVSAAQITAICPPGAVGVVTITVITPGGTATAPTKFTYTSTS